MAVDLNEKISQDIRYLDSISKKLAERTGYNLEQLYFADFNIQLNNFNPRIVKEYWKKLIKDIKNKKKQELLNFYVHIPFCKNKCTYCNYYSKALTSEKEADIYVDYLIQNMQFFYKVFSGVSFKNLYIGGGTPSVLTCDQIKKLFSYLFRYFNFEKADTKTLEFNPQTMSLEKLRLIKKFGYNGISFGIQSFNQKILSAVKRGYQTYDSIKKIMEYSKKLKFEYVNVDLIIGLKGQDTKSFLETFYKTLELCPLAITIYQLEPTKKYLSKFYNGRANRFYEERKKLILEVLRYIRPIAKKFNYESSSLSTTSHAWIFSVKRDSHSTTNNLYSKIAGYSDFTHEPYSIFALGPSSRSHIYGYLSYTNFAKKYKFNPQELIFRGNKLSLKDEMIKYILCQIIKYSKISKRLFKENFNSELIKNFNYAITALKKLKKIKIKEDIIYFLPTEKKERFIYSMFFLV